MTLRDHISKTNDSTNRKPSARDYLRNNPEKDGELLLVNTVDLTQNGLWLRLHTNDCTAFIHADNKIAENLLTILEQSDQKWGYALQIRLDSTNYNYSVSINLDKTKKRYYSYSTIEQRVTITDYEKKSGGSSELTLEDFGFTELNSTNITMISQNGLDTDTKSTSNTSRRTRAGKKLPQ